MKRIAPAGRGRGTSQSFTVPSIAPVASARTIKRIWGSRALRVAATATVATMLLGSPAFAAVDDSFHASTGDGQDG